MSDTKTVLNPGVGGSIMDESGVDYSGELRHRPRVVLTGEEKESVLEIVSNDPLADSYGVVVRPVHSPYPGASVCDLQTATLIPVSTETTVWQRTIDSGKRFFFLGFVGASDCDGSYRVYVESDLKLGARSTPAQLTTQVSFAYSPFYVSEGETIRLKFTHWRAIMVDTSATVIGYEIDVA